MKKIILIINILALSNIVNADKLIRVDRNTKTPTYEKNEEMIIYKNHKHRPYNANDMINLYDSSRNFDGIEKMTPFETRPQIRQIENPKTYPFLTNEKDYNKTHHKGIYRSFYLGTMDFLKENDFKNRIYTEGIWNPSGPNTLDGIHSSSFSFITSYNGYFSKYGLHFGNIVNELSTMAWDSKGITNPNHTDNSQLFVNAFMNDYSLDLVKPTKEISNFVLPSKESFTYPMFGVEAQKYLRSERINTLQYYCGADLRTENQKVKNDVSFLIFNSNIPEMLYIDMDENDKNYYRTKLEDLVNNKIVPKKCFISWDNSTSAELPMYARSNSVIDFGEVYNGSEITNGNSFSTPRVAGTAAAIHKRFKGISYHQIKQFILTGAEKEKSQLSNYYGWGAVNFMNSIMGPKALNAGLIEEQKFFTGMYDKVIGPNGRPFFWAEIEEGNNWDFSNDVIEGGLKEKPTGKTCVNALLDTKDTNRNDEKQIVAENFCFQNYIESEKNFYHNSNDIETMAGLRKAGKGSLNIYGRLEYYGPTQVLEGTLLLHNNSINSNLVLYENATLIIEKENRTLSFPLITITGGKLEIKTPVNLKELAYKNDNSEIILKSTLNVDKVVVENEAMKEKFIAKYKGKIKYKEIIIEEIYTEDVTINEYKLAYIKREFFLNNLKNTPNYDYFKYENMPTADNPKKAHVMPNLYDKIAKVYTRNEYLPLYKKREIGGYNESTNTFTRDMDSDIENFRKDFFLLFGNYYYSGQDTFEEIHRKRFMFKP